MMEEYLSAMERKDKSFSGVKYISYAQFIFDIAEWYRLFRTHAIRMELKRTIKYATKKLKHYHSKLQEIEQNGLTK